MQTFEQAQAGEGEPFTVEPAPTQGKFKLLDSRNKVLPWVAHGDRAYIERAMQQLR